MKTPDEIKKGMNDALPDHVHFHKGDPEPHLTHFNYHALECLHADALAYIQQLEADNAELLTKVEQLQAERDALISDFEQYDELPCALCEHYSKKESEIPCKNCKNLATPTDEDKVSQWEWRGVQKEE